MVSTDRGTINLFIQVELQVTPVSPTTPNASLGWYGTLSTSDPSYIPNSGYDYNNEVVMLTTDPLTPATWPTIPSTDHGNYGSPIYEPDGYLFTMYAPDYGTSLILTGGTGAANGGSASLPSGGGTGPTNFLMQAYESGGSCSGSVERVWLATGTPDLTGSQYTGTRCSPTPGVFSNFSIIYQW